MTEAVRKKPYTVVLLDEVEKAHPKVLTILLQVLDEGRLTDSKGRAIDGAECLFGLTESSTEDEKDVAHDKVMATVRHSFAPEFLNRISAIVVFNSLGTAELEKVVYKSMQGIKRRLAQQGVKVKLEKSGASVILEASFDPSFGARPVERYLEGEVVTALSRMLISGELTSGTIVHIEGRCVEPESVPVAKKPRKSRLLYLIEHDATNDNGQSITYNSSKIEEMPTQ